MDSQINRDVFCGNGSRSNDLEHNRHSKRIHQGLSENFFVQILSLRVSKKRKDYKDLYVKIIVTYKL
jgi:hypothetical protein